MCGRAYASADRVRDFAALLRDNGNCSLQYMYEPLLPPGSTGRHDGD